MRLPRRAPFGDYLHSRFKFSLDQAFLDGWLPEKGFSLTDLPNGCLLHEVGEEVEYHDGVRRREVMIIYGYAHLLDEVLYLYRFLDTS